MNIIFRRLQPEDVTQYRSLRLECLREFPDHFGANYEEESAKPRLWMEAMIAENNSETFMIGAFDEDRLIGICGINREPAYKRRHIAHVVQMYVQARYAGQKIGLHLLQTAIAEAWKIPELEQLILEVVTSSQSAIHVYAQAGFEQFGFHKDLLKIGNRYEDAFLMVLFRDEPVL